MVFGKYLVAESARIGIKLVPTNKLENALSKDVYGGKVDTYFWYWSGDPDPNYLLSIESGFTLDGWNDNFWDNASYNALYVKQLSDTNFTQRQKDVRAAEKLNYESAVYIIYIFPYGEWAWRTDRFTGWGDWNAHPYRQMDAFWGANPLGWVNGTVKDSTTQLGISGAGVRTSPGNYSGLTDSTGAYSILLPPGAYSVTAGASLYESKTTTGVTVSANTVTVVNFLLVPARGWIAGTVRSAVGNTAIAGAAIYIYASGGQQYAVTTNAPRSYNKSLAPRQYSVNASATGYFSSNKTGIVVVDGQTKTVDFSLNPLPQPPTRLSPLVIAGSALVIVAALVAVAVFLVMRRRKKEEEAGKIEIPSR